MVNLSKNIQIKTPLSDNLAQIEEISEYFPSFLWIIRDFALQLVDKEGRSMTSQEYLEHAL